MIISHLPEGERSPEPVTDLALASFERGMALYRANSLQEAAGQFKQAIRLKPDFFEALANLANLYRLLGRQTEALEHFQAALRLNPNSGPLHANLGLLYKAMDLIEEARQHFELAINNNFTSADLYGNLGEVLIILHRFAEAEACLQKGIELKLDPMRTAVLKHFFFFYQGDYPQAEKALDLILNTLPDNPEAHTGKAYFLLTIGELARGWPEYEWRFKYRQAHKSKNINVLDLPYPRWDGASLEGKTVLIQPEQGNGDTIQFIRYLPLVKERGGRVIFSCPPSLLILFKDLPGADLVVAREDVKTLNLAIDLQAPLLSLPGIFKTTLETIPATVPYLKVDPTLNNKWAKRLSREKGFKVGIVWAGSPTHTNDKLRSCPLAFFVPLAKIPGITIFSLQKGAEAETELKSLPANNGIINLAAELSDFAETAAAIENLDLIITVDTAVAHLAGALGKPVWTLLPLVPDWRWLLKREDSPWYPSMKLFRQKELGDWAELFTRVTRELGGIITVQ